MTLDVRTSRMIVERSARIALLGVPSAAVRELWIACHGYGQLAPRFARSLGALAAPQRLIVAPEALNRFYLDGRVGPHGPDSRVGATWMTREEREAEIDDYVRYLDRVHAQMIAQLASTGSHDAGAERDIRVVAFGFSQGVATISRWAARTSARIDEIVLWAASIPPELTPRADLFGTAHVTLVAGDDDEFASAASHAEYAAALRASGMRFAELRFSGGHRLDDATLRALADTFELR